MRPLRFVLDDTLDTIQECLAQGRFYEEEELHALKALSKPGWVILDIGANVGNHAIYFDKYFEAKEVIVIEPLPQAYRMLLMNVALNYCHRVNLDYIGLALGDKNGTCDIAAAYMHNLGGTRLAAAEQGPIQMTTGDNLLNGRAVDFIKMDVEGMELQVLQGLKNTITRYKPLMFVEVDNDNAERFWSLMQEFGYRCIQSFSRYSTNQNHILVPV